MPKESRSDLSGMDRESFMLLNDQPISDPEDDFLGTNDIASGIGNMLISSRAAAPFVLAVDASWGMGKSTLLRQIESHLSRHDEMTTVWFNAWTAEGSSALEGLIKSVLEELDSNLVRRWTRKLTRRRSVVGAFWIGIAILFRLFGVARLVDELWKQLSIDAKTRNDLRVVIHDMLTDWVKSEGRPDGGRCIVVFVDDLDRCSDEVVVQVCEAVKLYLDAPGLVFVLASDQSVLARGVSASARGGADEGRSYLEKVVQITYRVPLPEDSAIRKLVRGYALKSRTKEILDDKVERILTEGTDRNPRKIKRIINSFILEYQLDPAWRDSPLSSGHLVTAILLQHLYTEFYDLLVGDESGQDPIEEFLGYVEIRKGASDLPKGPDDPLWSTVERVFREHQLEWPSLPTENLANALERLEQKLPEKFPEFAGKNSLVSLLKELGDNASRQALRAQLNRRPLTTEAGRQNPSRAAFIGLELMDSRIVCVDDNPDSIARLVRALEDLGASVHVYHDPIEAEHEILRQEPDAVISDITRGEDSNSGFTYAERLRNKGYTGPIVFFTGRITPERRHRARELGAVDIVTSEHSVIEAITQKHGSRLDGR